MVEREATTICFSYQEYEPHCQLGKKHPDVQLPLLNLIDYSYHSLTIPFARMNKQQFILFLITGSFLVLSFLNMHRFAVCLIM